MKRKILLVDDNLTEAETDKDYLELSDFVVTIETDGSKGLDMAMAGTYDLLILNAQIPGTNGFDICEAFRKKHLAPVILISASEETRDKIHGLGLGADDYLTRPFNSSELVARVKAHLNRFDSLTGSKRGQSVQNDVILTGDLHIDTKARRVFARGEEKVLTMKEFDLLCFFARHPDTVLSKSVLYEKVWGYPVNTSNEKVDMATVIVHIKKLRSKIERNPSSKPEYIETMWGSGYRFNTLEKTVDTEEKEE